MQSGCPRTCLFPNGADNCGIIGQEEGCFCVQGYVRGANGDCVLPEDCGCRLSDNTTVIPVI